MRTECSCQFGSIFEEEYKDENGKTQTAHGVYADDGNRTHIISNRCCTGGKVRELQEFGKAIIEDLISRIKMEFNTTHLQAYSESLSRKLSDGEKLVLGRTVSFEGRKSQLDQAAAGTHGAVVVSGRPGIGKSTFMAQLCGILRKNQHSLVVSAFIGASGRGSCSLEATFAELCKGLQGNTNEVESEDKGGGGGEIPTTIHELKALFQRLLVQVSETTIYQLI